MERMKNIIVPKPPTRAPISSFSYTVVTKEPRKNVPMACAPIEDLDQSVQNLHYPHEAFKAQTQITLRMRRQISHREDIWLCRFALPRLSLFVLRFLRLGKHFYSHVELFLRRAGDEMVKTGW